MFLSRAHARLLTIATAALCIAVVGLDVGGASASVTNHRLGHPHRNSHGKRTGTTRSGLPVRKAETQTCLDVGISSNYQWNVSIAASATDVPTLKTFGIATIREDIFWNVVQPSGPNVWNWAQYDRLFTMASRQGVDVLPIIDYGTVWASAPGTAHDMPVTASGQAAYAVFAAAVVSRYGPNGTFWAANPDLTPRPFTAIELWNEPWSAGHPVAVGTYVSLLHLAGAAIKTVDPAMTTLANVDDRWTTMTDSSLHYWGQAVLAYASRLTPVIGGWAIHPYSEGQWNGNAPAADAMRQMNWLQNLLVTNHIPGRIWVTEVGFSTTVPAPYSAATAYAKFLQSVGSMTGPNAPQHVIVFTAARPWAGTKLGSWDYGFNLLNAAGRPGPQLAAIAANRCS